MLLGHVQIMIVITWLLCLHCAHTFQLLLCCMSTMCHTMCFSYVDDVSHYAPIQHIPMHAPLCLLLFMHPACALLFVAPMPLFMSCTTSGWQDPQGPCPASLKSTPFVSPCLCALHAQPMHHIILLCSLHAWCRFACVMWLWYAYCACAPPPQDTYIGPTIGTYLVMLEA